MESYLVATETISFLHKNKIPSILFKVDFTKAFDSVSWCFLINLLIERGFPPLWSSWVLNILRSSTSAVLINGRETQTFRHARGLRQGDPLSPLLFILVADALQCFLTNATHLMENHVALSPRALQFADDTAIIMEAHPKNLRIVAGVLRQYASITGLTINNNKFCFIPIAIKQQYFCIIQSLLSCQVKTCPISYLGLPLSPKKLKKVHYQPLLAAVQRRLQGWKTNFLSLAGRLTLVKAVLSAMPLHFMQVIRLPSWVINQIDKMRRNFLWRGKNKCLGGHCLVNWDKCCMPRQHGGLGILNLRTQNEALLAKWIWVLGTKSNSVWSSTIRDLYGTSDLNILKTNPIISSCLVDLLKKSLLFQSISNAMDMLSTPTWKWSTDGRYTVSSAYKLMSWSGVISPFYRQLWKSKVPPKVKFFLWLLQLDRLLTQQNLLKRGWPTIQSCKLCHLQAMESADHLFVCCPFSKQIISSAASCFNIQVHLEDTNAFSLWQLTRDMLPSHLRAVWTTLWAATCWSIWKHRCSMIFDNRVTTAHQLVCDIETRTRQWLLAPA